MEESGGQFLHQKDSRLHTATPIENTQKRLKTRGEKTSQKPADKIEAYLSRIKDILAPEPLDGHRSFDRKQRNINLLRRDLHESMVIEPEHIPESYFSNQKRLAREQGHGDIEITGEMRNQLSEVIISDQKSTLDNWVDYFTSPDSDGYPIWAKYWAFTGMSKLSTYDKEKHSFSKRRKDTVAPFPDLNREALAYAIDIVVKKINKENIPDTEDNPELQKLLQGANFGKLYAYAIEKVTPTEENELINTRGKWIKFPQNCDPMTYIPRGFSQPLVSSLQGHGTGWCTAGETTAKSQLQGGDFHVYYSYDKQEKPTIPRIAIRIKGPNIAEVRGIAPDQNLDPYIGDVVDEKLKEFPDGEAYQKKTADMKRLTEIDRKRKGGETLTKDDLRFLYEFDSIIEGFGHQRDPRIQEIRNIKSDLSHITGYSKEQISITKQEALRDGIKFHYGNLFLGSLRSAKGLQLPETVNGYLYLDSLRSAKGLRLPETVNGSLDLSNLRSAKGLQLPETVNGYLYLDSLRSAKGLQLPETVNGNLNLNSLRSAKGLQLPETVNGFLNLNSLQSAKGLQLPETVNGSLILGRLQSAEGLRLPETVSGNLYLNSLRSAKGLQLPETVNGYLYLSNLQSAEKERIREKYPNLRIY